MKVIFLILVVSKFIASATAGPCGQRSRDYVKVDGFSPKSDTITVLQSENNKNQEPLCSGDKYSYPENGPIYSPAAILAEEEYYELIVRLRGFSTGRVFRFQDFQKELPELRKTLSRIHNSVDPKKRHPRLDDYYGILERLMDTMKASVEEMSNWADKFYGGVNLVYEMHELRLLSLSLFGADGFPDVRVEGFEHKVKSLDSEWSRLKANYENLMEKTALHDQFVPISGQTRVTIDLLLKSQNKANKMASFMAPGTRAIG